MNGGLNLCIEYLKSMGYSVMFTNDLSKNLLVIRLGKSGMYLQKCIPMDDRTVYVLGEEQVKINYLSEMRKELDEELKKTNYPRWTNYQIETLNAISSALEQLAYTVTSERLRRRLLENSIMVKNVIPMELIKMKGENEL